MAITRRQFVTRLSTLAAAMGMSQVDLAKVTEAFAHGSAWATPASWADKPKVVWVHGAECTGCSTSLLSLFEDVRGKAVVGTTISTLKALDLAVGGSGNGNAVLNGTSTAVTTGAEAGHPWGHRTVQNTSAITGVAFDSYKNADTPYIANIADVLVDFIDLEYHETVMGAGGDLAYQLLHDQMVNATNGRPFVLVVEGAVQPTSKNGYWNATGAVPWCSIGKNEADTADLAFPEVVEALAIKANCAAIIPIGQCACFGGYPACISPVLAADAQGIANGASMTGAMGVSDFLKWRNTGDTLAAAAKVVNVPGCPTNPWWFILTVVAWLVDYTQPTRPLGILTTGGAINPAAVDSEGRLKAVYGMGLHGAFCTRYQAFLNNSFATQPGDPGCLQLIGCKGPQTMTLCAAHGWNGQQPTNDATYDYSIQALNGVKGGNCVAGGHPCMGCTEQGYPDAFLPFVVR